MSPYFTLVALLFIYMSFWFIFSVIKKRNDVADVAWGLGFVFLAWSSFFIHQSYEIKPFLVNMLVSIWGIRLAWHIHARNKNKAEDYRYLEWRKQWGSLFYIRSFLQVYMLQGLFLFLIVFPVLFVNIESPSILNIFDYIGVIIWILGFIFESVGDKQLAVFLNQRTDKAQVLQTGLWKYSRHPNYFGEVTQWWGLFILALSSGGMLTVISPLTITTLILFVSGIPLLEKKQNQNPLYREYAKRTSKFVPLPPRLI